MRRAHESLQGPSFLHVDSVPRPSQQVDTGTTRFETQLRAPLKTSSSFEVVPVRQAIGSSQQASIGKFANNPAETLIDTGKSSVVLLLALCKAGNLRQNHRGRLCQERPRVCGFFHLVKSNIAGQVRPRMATSIRPRGVPVPWHGSHECLHVSLSGVDGTRLGAQERQGSDRVMWHHAQPLYCAFEPLGIEHGKVREGQWHGRTCRRNAETNAERLQKQCPLATKGIPDEQSVSCCSRIR